MFMPLALFTSCYEDIEGDEIVYDIDFDKLFPDKKKCKLMVHIAMQIQ